MPDELKPSGTGDLLGLAPYGEAIKLVADRTLTGLGLLLSWICKPASEELGLLFRDKVRIWRCSNAEKIATETLRLLEEGGHAPGETAPPQLVHAVLEHGSWTDDDLLQRLWAGILASSCTADGKDMRGHKFVDLLQRLSPSQARLMKHTCDRSVKRLFPSQLLMADAYIVSLDEIRRVTGLETLEDLDADLDHLRHLGLLNDDGGISIDSDGTTANIAPSGLGLYMFARCSGAQSAASFYKDVLTVEAAQQAVAADGAAPRR